ncbi:hypothetical protein HYX11_01440 [Candidatus Woesearchaeota archaeon]|nr:hypothetical protein [Candidatus Woesearchaeota archaeon]
MSRFNWTEESVAKMLSDEQDFADENALAKCLETACGLLPEEVRRKIDRERLRQERQNGLMEIYQKLSEGQRTEVNVAAERLGYSIEAIEGVGILHRTTPYKSNLGLSGGY